MWSCKIANISNPPFSQIVTDGGYHSSDMGDQDIVMKDIAAYGGVQRNAPNKPYTPEEVPYRMCLMVDPRRQNNVWFFNVLFFKWIV